MINGPTPGLPLRRVIFWLHLACGVVAGLVILMMSVTGVLLTYENQLIQWADRGYRSSPPSPDALPLPLDQILAGATAANPNATPTTIKIYADPDAPVSVGLGGRRAVYLDAYSGAVLGSGSQGIRTFFRTITGWHRWFNFSGEKRSIGRAVTGASNMMFLFLVLSGLYLWFPRVWTWPRFRKLLRLEVQAKGKAREFNWHHVFGFWAAIPLAVVVASAAFISYPSLGTALSRLGSDAPRANPSRIETPAVTPVTTPPELARLDALMIPAASQLADWRSITVTVPEDGSRPLAFRIDQGNGRQPQKRHTMTVDPETAEIVSWQPFDSLPLGRRLRSYARFGHTGEVWGVWGQTIAGVASFAGVILVWTGLMLAMRRLVLEPLRRRRREGESADRELAPIGSGGAQPLTPRNRRRRREGDKVA